MEAKDVLAGGMRIGMSPRIPFKQTTSGIGRSEPQDFLSLKETHQKWMGCSEPRSGNSHIIQGKPPVGAGFCHSVMPLSHFLPLWIQSQAHPSGGKTPGHLAPGLAGGGKLRTAPRPAQHGTAHSSKRRETRPQKLGPRRRETSPSFRTYPCF